MSPIDPTVALVFLLALGVAVVLFNVPALIILIKTCSRKKRMSYPLPWLLVANILIGVFPLPLYAMKKYDFHAVSARSKICDAFRFTYFTTTHMAMVSLIIMTFDRILVLKFSLRYPIIATKAKLDALIGFSWLAIVVYDTIPFFPVQETDTEYCYYKVKKTWAVVMDVLTIAVSMPAIVIGYLYMVFIAFSQASNIRSLTRTQISRGKSLVCSIRLAMEIKATKKVSYVISSYIICWTPSEVYYLLEWVCSTACLPRSYEPHRTWIRFFFKLLIMAHALITPMLFCWQNKLFRKDARRVSLKLGINMATRTKGSRTEGSNNKRQ